MRIRPPRVLPPLLALALAACAHAPNPADEAEPRFDLKAACDAGKCLRPTPPTAETFELARRLGALQDGDRTMDQSIQRAGMIVGRILPVQPGFAEAIAQASRENPQRVEAARDALIEVYARNYTDEELRALIGYLTDPMGAAIHHKRRNTTPGTTVAYTPAEQAWIRENEGSVMGRALADKKLMVTMLGAMASTYITEPISKRAHEIYCAKNPCPARRR